MDVGVCVYVYDVVYKVGVGECVVGKFWFGECSGCCCLLYDDVVDVVCG